MKADVVVNGVTRPILMNGWSAGWVRHASTSQGAKYGMADPEGMFGWGEPGYEPKPGWTSMGYPFPPPVGVSLWVGLPPTVLAYRWHFEDCRPNEVVDVYLRWWSNGPDVHSEVDNSSLERVYRIRCPCSSVMDA
jgi:hypothetical protein